MNSLEKVKYISNWIKTYVDQMPSKAQSLIIGISGGIDSSVSSTLSAMTGLKTIVLSMPIKQKENQHDLSLKHQEWLIKKFNNVEAHTINLDNLFETFSSTLNKFDNEHGFANSRARLRMTTLYQVAAANKGIVVGTRSETRLFRARHEGCGEEKLFFGPLDDKKAQLQRYTRWKTTELTTRKTDRNKKKRFTEISSDSEFSL